MSDKREYKLRLRFDMAIKATERDDDSISARFIRALLGNPNKLQEYLISCALEGIGNWLGCADVENEYEEQMKVLKGMLSSLAIEADYPDEWAWLLDDQGDGYWYEIAEPTRDAFQVELTTHPFQWIEPPPAPFDRQGAGCDIYKGGK